MKRSAQIALAGATALAAAGGASLFRSSPRSESSFSGTPLTAEAVPDMVAPEVEYTNDFEVPGAGFYHAPYHAWFPRKWNDYDPTQGYFHGGTWSPQPEVSQIVQSKPTTQAAFAANALYKETVVAAQQQNPGYAGGNSFHSGGSYSHYRTGSGWHWPTWRSSGSSGRPSTWGSSSSGSSPGAGSSSSSSGFHSGSFGTSRGGFGSSASSHSSSSSS